MARIYWDAENYTQVERIFKQSAEFCSEHDVWRLNVAHTLFMQDNGHYKVEPAGCLSTSSPGG